MTRHRKEALRRNDTFFWQYACGIEIRPVRRKKNEKLPVKSKKPVLTGCSQVRQRQARRRKRTLKQTTGPDPLNQQHLMIDFISVPHSASTIVIQVSGNFTEMDRRYFFDCVSDFIDSGYKHVIIECHQLGFLNSSGLSALLVARKQTVKRGGRVYLTHVSSRLAEVLALTKLGKLLSVYPTTESVITSIEDKLLCAG